MLKVKKLKPPRKRAVPVYPDIIQWTTAKERMEIAATFGITTRVMVSYVLRNLRTNEAFLQAMADRADENKAKSEGQDFPLCEL